MTKNFSKSSEELEQINNNVPPLENLSVGQSLLHESKVLDENMAKTYSDTSVSTNKISNSDIVDENDANVRNNKSNNESNKNNNINTINSLNSKNIFKNVIDDKNFNDDNDNNNNNNNNDNNNNNNNNSYNNSNSNKNINNNKKKNNNNNDDIDDDDDETDCSIETPDEEVQPFTGESIPPVDKRISKTDAISLVGGHSILESSPKLQHSQADRNKSTQQQHHRIAAFATDESTDMDTYDTGQKTFSFSLPFGGFGNLNTITHSISKRLPFNNSSAYDDDARFHELKQEMKLKLQRQQTINTIDEINYFKNITGTDNVRMRAVKSSLSFLPGFKKQTSKGVEPYETIYNEISGNIVILGGFRGSILKETKTNRRVWVPFKAGIHLRKVNLLLGPKDEDELNAADYIYPSGILSHIGPVDICRKFIKKLKANPKTNVTEWGYDWRLSGEVISDQLVKVLTNIYKSTGKPSIVIGHSMGGLMAHGALQKAPHLFRGVIYVGSPSECCNVLGPIRYGDSVLLSDKILTFETNFMMRSAFNFLPLNGRIFANLEKDEFYDLDYFDPDTWVEYNLNPLVSKRRLLYEKKMNVLPEKSIKISNSDSHSTFSSITTSLKKSWKNSPLSSKSSSISSFSDSSKANLGSSTDEILDCGEDYDYCLTFSEAYDYLTRALAKAKSFMTSLEWRQDLEDQYPPLAIVYGNKVPSVRGSNVRSKQDIRDGNYYEFYYGHGDGVVHQRWLMPERKGFKYFDEATGKGEIVGKFASDCGHVNLMTDFKAMGQALSAIHEAEKNWKLKKSRLKNKISE